MHKNDGDSWVINAIYLHPIKTELNRISMVIKKKNNMVDLHLQGHKDTWEKQVLNSYESSTLGIAFLFMICLWCYVI